MFRVAEVEVKKADRTARSSEVGLLLAAAAVAPLVVFAALWTGLLLMLGATWALHVIGLM